MGYRFEILAAKYPFKGCWDKSIHPKTFVGLVVKIVILRMGGYDIIDVGIRDRIKK